MDVTDSNDPHDPVAAVVVVEAANPHLGYNIDEYHNPYIQNYHFGPNKVISSLDYNGSDIEFETIELNVTTWSFYQPPSVPGFGEFVLDGDLTNPYGFYVTNNNWTITEHTQSTASNMQMGGSSRPISATIYSYSDSIVYFYVQNGYTSIANQNYSYFSELKFKKVESW